MPAPSTPPKRNSKYWDTTRSTGSFVVSEVRLDRIEAKLDKIDETLTNLTRVEERQTHMMSQMNTILATMAKHDERLRVVEHKVAAAAPVLNIWEKVTIAVITGGGGVATLWALITRPWAQ